MGQPMGVLNNKHPLSMCDSVVFWIFPSSTEEGIRSPVKFIGMFGRELISDRLFEMTEEQQWL
jgi:hypothetical protein